jgi:hypothetical protein
MTSLLSQYTATGALISSPPLLQTHLRYADLFAAKIVRNWTTLMRLIEQEGFPPGRMLGRNTRVWTVEEVKTWLATRPVERKPVPRRYRKRAA